MKKFINSFSYIDLILFQRVFLGLLLFFLLKNGIDTCQEVRFHSFMHPNGLMNYIPGLFFNSSIFTASFIALCLLCLTSLFFTMRWYIILPLTILYIICMGVSETLFTTYDLRFFHVKSTLIAPLIGLSLSSFLNRNNLPEKSYHFGLPIVFTHTMLALIYLGPTLKRLIAFGFPGWYNGETLRIYLIESSILFSNPLAMWIAEIAWLCMALQIFVLIFEGTFWIGLFNNKFLRFSLIGALCFHLGVEVLMRANYLDYFLCLFSIFVTTPYRARLYSGQIETSTV